MAIKLITAPAKEPVSLSEAKLHLRVDHGDEDQLISSLVKTARQMIETLTGRALITQTLELVADNWPDTFYLRPPLQSITSIKYKDTDGTESTVDSGGYITDIDNEPGRVTPAYGEVWPTTTLYPIAGIRVRFVSGYGLTEADVPAPLRQAMLLLIGHLYENREEVTAQPGIVVAKLPWAVEQLIAPYRMWGTADL